MTDKEDYRLYLESRFDALTTLMNARFTVIDEANDKTNDHLKTLNGTVKEHTDKISELRLSDEMHIANCPAMPKIDEMEKNLIEYNFFKRHPTVSFIVMAVIVVGMLISAYGTLKSVATNKESKEIKQSVDGIRYELAPTRSYHPPKDTSR